MTDNRVLDAPLLGPGAIFSPFLLTRAAHRAQYGRTRRPEPEPSLQGAEGRRSNPRFAQAVWIASLRSQCRVSGQNELPGSLRNSVSSGVDFRPSMPLRC